MTKAKQRPQPETLNYAPSQPPDSTQTPVIYMKKQFFLFPGIKIRILDCNLRLISKAYGLPFRLREKINIYSDEMMRHKTMVSSTKKIIDWNVTFELTRVSDNTSIGSIRRRGWSSEFVRDAWVICDKNGKQVAELLEDSARKGLIRRFIFRFLPQVYIIKTKAGNELLLRQSWNPIFLHYRGYSAQWRGLLSELGEPLLIGALSTIAVIEGRQ